MSPRPYRRGQRQVTADKTRARILAAARELLETRDGFSGFSIDAVARQADVARMTVYYQFSSKIGLLEALTDVLAAQGGMQQLASAFRQPDPLEAMDIYITVFSRFWDGDRLVTGWLRALAALDPDFEHAIQVRNEQRRQGLRALVGILAQQSGRLSPEMIHEAVDILYTLLSFETFDALAGPKRGLEDVAPIIQRLARAVLGLGD